MTRPPHPTDPAPTPASGNFHSTHWSLVLAAADSRAPGAADALERLCRVYWKPIHAFVRRTGRSHEDALDLTQAFFAHLLEHGRIRLADPDRGRFRSFLLGTLRHFLAHRHEHDQAQRRGGRATFIPLDVGTSDAAALEPVAGLSPDLAFDQRWALEQIERALRRLRDDYAADGRAALFDLLKAYVWGDRNDYTLGQIAEELDLTEEAVKKALQRLRTRFRDTLRDEIGRTLGSPDQIDEELRHLRQALCGPT